MEIILDQKPKGPVVISGFPGIGMVGAIAAEFLTQHLDTKHIGRFFLDKSPAMVAIHEGKLIEPFGIYYSRKYNIIVVHSIVAVPGSEWQVAAALLEICKQVGAKELINIEGVGSSAAADGAAPATVESKTYYYTTSPAKEKVLNKQKVALLTEGIIMGPTSAVLMKAGSLPVTCFFAETHTDMPDSNAAAQVIRALDGYLKLNVDYKPLLELATKFEQKLKILAAQSQKAEELRDKKAMSYVG